MRGKGSQIFWIRFFLGLWAGCGPRCRLCMGECTQMFLDSFWGETGFFNVNDAKVLFRLLLLCFIK